MKKPQRILIFSLAYVPFIGGAELALKAITDRIASGEIEFDLVTLRFKRELPRVERVGNITVHRVGFSQRGATTDDTFHFPLSLNKALFPLLATWKALRLNRARHYSAAWAIMANHAGFAALFFSLFRPRVPFVLMLQEGDPIEHILRRVGVFKPFFKQIFCRAAVVTAISNYLADFAREMGARGSVEVVPNGVDLKNFQFPPDRTLSAGQAMSNFRSNPNALISKRIVQNGLRGSLGISEADRVVITVSRLVWKNGVDTLIEAVRFLPENVKLLIAGTGPLLEECQSLVARHGLEKHVHFLGHLDHAELPHYLALADVFCRPSRSEGLGSAFLEAMAAGVPVVATPVGGIPDFLQHKKTGLFAEADNSESVAAQIRRFLEGRTLCERIVVNAYEMVEKRYDWNMIAERIRGLFKGLEHSSQSILIATPLYPPEIGGPATFARFAEEELPKRGVAVSVEKFSEVRHFPKIVRYIVYFWRLVRAARGVDVALALDPLGVGLPTMLAARIRGKRFLVRVAGDRAWETLQSKVSHEFPISNNQFSNKFQIPNFQTSNIPDVEEFQKRRWDFTIELRRLLQRMVAKRAERVIVPSEYLKRIVAMWGVPNEKITVVYSSFESPKIRETKEEARAAFGLTGSVIVSAGRLVPWKGFSVLVEMMPQFLGDVPDAQLVIIGDGPERAALEQQATSNKQQAVTFLGRLPQRELHRYIRAADVFVLNSGYEGLSHQLLEAMALGTPIVASDIPGNRELIENELSGLLVDYNDREGLRRATVRLLTDHSFAERIALAAQEHVAVFNGSRAIDMLARIICHPV